MDRASDLALRDDVDVVVELIGGDEGPARELIELALENGKDVVTANKALLAVHGQALAELAEGLGRTLRFEAAVAGGIPVIKAMTESLAGNEIRGLLGPVAEDVAAGVGEQSVDHGRSALGDRSDARAGPDR